MCTSLNLNKLFACQTQLFKWQYSNDDESHKYLIDANEHQCDRYIHLTDHKLFSSFFHTFFFSSKAELSEKKIPTLSISQKKTSRQHFCETAFFMPNHCLALLISFRLFCVHGMHYIVPQQPIDIAGKIILKL